MPDEERSEVRRRILDVDVNEVSLVDRAANLRRFLVVKRNDEEDKKMGAFKSDEAVEKAKKPDEEEEMKAKAKAAEEEEEEKKKAADEKAKAEAEEEEEKKKAMNPSAIAGMLRGLKGAPKEVKAVIDWLDSKKAEKQDEEEEEEEEDYPSPKAKANTKKSVDEGDLPAVQVMQDGSVIVSGQPVHKGKKFTASRTSAIKDVTMTLLKLIGEVDPDTMKSIEEALKELPKDPKWNQGVKATGTGDSVKLGKQEEEEEDEEKAALKKEVTDLKKRLEKIEEERPVSKSIDEEGGTEKKVEKSDGVSWKGII
jgi:hypothetical protein